MRNYERSAEDFLQPIPLELPDIKAWNEVPLHENGEPLVALGAFSDYSDIFTSSVYAGEHSNSPYWRSDRKLEDALMTQFVRSDVAQGLRHAQSRLPAGHYLIVLDSYRTLQVQRALYDHYHGTLAQRQPDWTAEQLRTETQKYVSIPSDDPTRPSPHNTGGSVDLAIFTLPEIETGRLTMIEKRIRELKTLAPETYTPEDEAYNPVLRELYLQEMAKLSLVRTTAQFLNFGTPFDYGGPEAASNYFEVVQTQRELSPSELIARDNRRELYNAMMIAGLPAYRDEWWHYNSPKSQMGARALGLDHAEYGGMRLDESNAEHETMRGMHHAGLIRIHEGALQGIRYRSKAVVWNDLTELNEQALAAGGDPRLTHLARAAVIEPPEAA